MGNASHGAKRTDVDDDDDDDDDDDGESHMSPAGSHGQSHFIPV